MEKKHFSYIVSIWKEEKFSTRYNESFRLSGFSLRVSQNLYSIYGTAYRTQTLTPQVFIPIIEGGHCLWRHHKMFATKFVFPFLNYLMLMFLTLPRPYSNQISPFNITHFVGVNCSLLDEQTEFVIHEQKKPIKKTHDY